MKYNNPIISGSYPDPSICFANGSYYLVASSFDLCPGLPVFVSEDLLNWKQTGHVFQIESEIGVKKYTSPTEFYAPTIRYANKMFYVVTTNVATNETLLFKSQNPYEGWESAQIIEGWFGIDPSLFFDEDGTCYIQGTNDSKNSEEVLGIYQAELDIDSAEVLTKRILLTSGAGYKSPEAPHIYKKDDYYYLSLAEGGT